MEKTKGQELKEKLFIQKKAGWEKLANDVKEKILKFNEGYISFLNTCKTERECALYARKVLEEHGFINLEEVGTLSPGDKVYYINRKKAVYAAVIGEDMLEDGLNLVGAHIDSPRLDLKPNPLYEAGGLALLKTHYYGGIKKYQWTTIPLSMRGVIVKADGEVIDICIGENEDDPIFTITDLLPHLAYKQEKKTLGEGIAGEDLNILVGSIPYDDEKVDEKIKLNIMNLLHEKYGIVEKDFTSAEIEIVPAFPARSLGFDKSMVAAYGQDDRSCAYTTLMALVNLDSPRKTAVALLADKEEIGSVGNTGMYSQNFEVFIASLLDKTGQNGHNILEKTLCHSKMLSSDVTSGADPNYPDVDDSHNAAYLGHGIALCKYTGSRGKSGASDASAEFVGYIRGILEKNKLAYQMADMGKVDEGGGGTIAYILANKGVDVLDCGVPVLSMHAPYEVTSKFDIYNAYEVYLTFYHN